MRGRVLVVTYRYDDRDHPDRVTSTITTPEWTDDDRAALLALAKYESTLCAGCQQEQAIAWHAESDGRFKGRRVVCFACSAMHGEEVVHMFLTEGPSDDEVAKYPPFDLSTMTAEPTKNPKEG